ncbi:unnamed protein product, partial [Closterium sp. NIES-53]
QVAALVEVAVSVEVAASCSCRLLTHQTLLWHHRLGHPFLITPAWHALPSPCVWPPQVPAPASEVACTALPSLRRGAAARRSSRLVSSYHNFSADPTHGRDLPVLRLHSDRGGEFPCTSLRTSVVARTSMIHVAAPHFLWPFAIRYADAQLNVWPRVSHPETSPTLQWTGEVGDASAFRVWGSLSLVRDLPTCKLSPHTLRCVFLGFPTDAPPWQFYHPGSRHVLSSRGITFEESVCFYRLHPHLSSLVPLPPLSLVVDASPVVPLPPPGPAPSGG